MGLNLESRLRKHGRKILLTSAFLGMFSYCGEKKSPTAPEIPPTGNNPPTAEITSGPTGTISQDYATFSWRGSDTDGQVVRYYRDMDDSTPDIETTETSFTFTNLNEGNHTFYVKAEDNGGAFSSIPSRSFRVDTSQPSGPIENGTSNSNGNTTFSNTSTTSVDIFSRLPTPNMSITYHNYDDAKVFISGDPNNKYFPIIDPFKHNSDHILEMTPEDIGNYLTEKFTGENLEAFQNWIGYITTNTICETGSGNMKFIETVSGNQMADYENVNRGITIMVLELLGIPYMETISALDDLLDITISDAITGINLRDTNWDKYEHEYPLSIVPEYMDIPSNLPSILLDPPEVSGNSITLTCDAFDSWTYPQPYSSVRDATIECSGPTPNNDFRYSFRILGSSQYNDWTLSGGWTTSTNKTITITNLPPGYYEAQMRVMDDTEINVTESEIKPFSIEGGELEIIAQYSYPGSNVSGITWDGDNILTSDLGSGVPGTYQIHRHDQNMNITRSYDIKFRPTAITWDGSNVWGCDEHGSKLYKLDSNMNIIPPSYSIPNSTTSLEDITWMGGNIWSSYIIPDQTDKIYKHNSSNPLYVTQYNTPAEMPGGFAWHGSAFFLYCSSTNKVYCLDSSMNECGEYPNPILTIKDLASDGDYLWAAENITNTITQLRTP